MPLLNQMLCPNWINSKLARSWKFNNDTVMMLANNYPTKTKPYVMALFMVVVQLNASKVTAHL